MSTSTTAAATATINNVDTNSVVADNQAAFHNDAGPCPAATDLSWICEEFPPVGPYDNQKTDIEVLMQYAVRQGFASSVFCSHSIGSKRNYLTGWKEKHYQKSHSRPTSMRDRGKKKVGCSCELVIMYDKHSPEEIAWSKFLVNN